MSKHGFAEILDIDDSNDFLFILFIPSKDKNGLNLPDQRQWAEAAARMLARLFGGATIMPPAHGAWLNPETGELVMEEVILVHSYARGVEAQLPEVMEEIARFLHRLGAETNQGEIGVVINGIFHRIRRFTLA